MLRDAPPLLQAHEQHLALALEAARMVAWTWDPAQDRVETVGNLLEIYGVPAVEFAEKGFSLVHPDDLARHQAIVDEAISSGAAYCSEFRILRPDNGQIVWIEERGVPVLDAAGHLQKLTGVVADISERKRNEATLQTARQAAEHAADRSARLHQLTAALTPVLSAATVTQIIVEQSAAALGASASAVYLEEDDQQWLSLASAIGYSAAVRQAVQRLPVNGSMPAADVVRTRQPLWLRSNAELVVRYPALAATRAATGNEAVAVIPLLVDNRALGVLALSFAAPQAFEADDRDFLLTLANQCASALERTRLYEAEQRARQQAEQAAAYMERLQLVTAALARALTPAAVAEAVIGRGGEALGTPSGAVLMLSPDGAQLEMIGSYHVPPEVAERFHHILISAPIPAAEAARSGRPLLFASQAEVSAAYPAVATGRDPKNQASASLPLVLGEQVIGVISFSLREVHAFTAEEQDYLLALGQQAAQALERSRLYQTAQELNARLKQRMQARTVELLESETRFHSLVNSVQDYAIFMLDPNGRVVSWNTGAQRIKGYAPDEIIGQHFSRFYTPEDVQQGVPARGLVRAAEAGRYEAEGWRVRKNGARFWANVIITPVYGKAGQLAGYAKVTRDLSERRQAEEAIRQNQRMLAEAQHIARLGSWHWDIVRDEVVISEELCEIYGLPRQPAAVPYERFLDYGHPDDRALAEHTIWGALQDRRPFDFDYRIVRADGLLRTLQLRGEVVADKLGQAIAVSGTAQDITERKHMEEELERSREQMRQLSARLEQTREQERGRMAREIHDELGGTLTALKMDVAQLRRAVGSALAEGAGLERLTDFSRDIDQAIETVRRIASELRPSILDDFGLIAAMEWQLAEFQRRSGLACEWQGSLDDVALKGESATAVFRVFQESLTNVARHAQATRVTVTVEASDHHLLLQVRDNGRGIDPDQVRSNQSFGLAGMRERMSIIGGEVDIQGGLGQGTAVVVKVPLEQTVP